MSWCSPRARLLVAASLLVSTACSNDTPSPTDVPRAVISVTTDPNPIPAVPSNRAGSTFSARFKVVIKELAGQGGEVQAVNSTIYDDSTGLIAAIVNYDTSDLIVFVGEKRVEAGGTLEVPLQLDYTIPGDPSAKAARLQVLVNLKDDRGNAVSSSVLVKVQ